MTSFFSSISNTIRRSLSEHDSLRQTHSSPEKSGDSSSAFEMSMGPIPGRARAVSEGDRNPFKDPASSEIIRQSVEEEDEEIEMDGESALLDPDAIRNIQNCLPTRLIGAKWQLRFATETHGFSLHAVYREFERRPTPALVVIRDTSDRVFGAFSSEPLRIQESFYGTGECFLYQSRPAFRCFRWTGKNEFFVSSTANDGLRFGASSGHFGLAVDDHLLRGSTEQCATFDNPPLTELTHGKFFEIVSMEFWGFQP